MKIVSFNIAKALKEAGYPQDYRQGSLYYNEKGQLMSYDWELEPLYGPIYCVCPYALQVWLWLWIKKNFYIKVQPIDVKFHWQLLEYQYDEWHSYGIVSTTGYQDPEEAIIAAIDYLVDNNLIK